MLEGFLLGSRSGLLLVVMWEFPKIRGYLILGSSNEDPTIQSATLGSPIFGNSHVNCSRESEHCSS